MHYIGKYLIQTAPQEGYFLHLYRRRNRGSERLGNILRRKHFTPLRRFESWTRFESTDSLHLNVSPLLTTSEKIQ